MSHRLCTCYYKVLINEPISTWSTILDFLFSLLISITGVVLNYRFLIKLKEEKRNKPVGRRGNVVGPVMHWFCILQIIYWPYNLLILWIHSNEIVPSTSLNEWICTMLLFILKLGRECIAYNSLFVALIRYIYIVIPQKTNQLDFEKTSKRFQIASIAVPISWGIIGTFTINSHGMVDSEDQFKHCVAFYAGLNSTDKFKMPNTYGYEFTVQFLPESLIVAIRYIYFSTTIIVILNIIEAFLYFKIFQNMHR